MGFLRWLDIKVKTYYVLSPTNENRHNFVSNFVNGRNSLEFLSLEMAFSPLIKTRAAKNALGRERMRPFLLARVLHFPNCVKAFGTRTRKAKKDPIFSALFSLLSESLSLSPSSLYPQWLCKPKSVLGLSQVWLVLESTETEGG